jgi:hypothetical protein
MKAATIALESQAHQVPSVQAYKTNGFTALHNYRVSANAVAEPGFECWVFSGWAATQWLPLASLTLRANAGRRVNTALA